MGVGVGNAGTKWILKTLAYTLARLSHRVSSSEADARSLESDSPASPPPEVSIYIMSCSWVLLLGHFQRKELGEAWEGRAAGEGPCESSYVGSWGAGGRVGLRGRGSELERESHHWSAFSGPCVDISRANPLYTFVMASAGLLLPFPPTLPSSLS